MAERYLRTADAARYLGVHPQTIRAFARDGRIACLRVGPRNERRFAESALSRFLSAASGAPATAGRTALLYVRVSGSSGQESSLAAQEADLRVACARDGAEVAGVFRDRASGLAERRRGLDRMLDLVARRGIDEVRVTHSDRLARFGTDFLRRLLAAYGTALVIEHAADDASSPQDELLRDFTALVSSFSGRIYGARSAAARRRLLESAG
jgi:excisionase family DNA binding protein